MHAHTSAREHTLVVPVQGHTPSGVMACMARGAVRGLASVVLSVALPVAFAALRVVLTGALPALHYHYQYQYEQ